MKNGKLPSAKPKKKRPAGSKSKRLKQLAGSIRQLDIPGTSAALAFHFFLSFIPTVLILSLLYRELGADTGTVASGIGILSSWLPPVLRSGFDSMGPLIGKIPVSGFLVTSVVLFAWSSTSGISRYFRFLEKHCGKEGYTRAWRIRSRAIALILLLGALGGGLIWLLGFAPAGQNDGTANPWFWYRVVMVTVFVSTCLFVLIKVGTPLPLRSRRVAMITGFTGTVWVSLTLFLDQLIGFSDPIQTSAGHFGAVFIFLLWLYATAILMVIAGAWASTVVKTHR
ncbi:MAG: YihY/virulence factor BrkB family protein [Bacteroidetes bacterium]|nr:YihY/virulence factor BrkB family protein [Bacteroidota bacterium]